MPMARSRPKKHPGIRFETFLSVQLKNRETRAHFEQRKLVHEVAVAVRAMREQAGLTQAQLARMIGASQPMIARMEKGLDQRTPRWETLRKIAVALGRQMKLSFVKDDDAPLVEIDGRPLVERVGEART